MKNKDYPFFCRIFRCLSPKDFVNVFRGEAYQTIAFLLSFSRSKRYVEKVLRIFNKEDLTTAVSFYLRNVAEEMFDFEFTKRIEAYLDIVTQRWKALSTSRHLRKNIFIRDDKITNKV